MKQGPWVEGNHFTLLENGEAYYPRVFEAIANAKQEVLVETFILFEDEVGLALQRVLIEAARRGARVELTVDGYGSPDLSASFISALQEAGVRLHVIDPRPTVLGVRTNLLRRLHRKLVVVDREIGFIGGLNFSIDHLEKSGPESKQDYAVEARGPIVLDFYRLMEASLYPARPSWQARWAERRFSWRSTRAARPAGDGLAMLIYRDNDRHRDDIERHYRVAFRAARHEVILANAYFFPGYRLLREMRNAARRGVQVHLILQGKADKSIARWAAVSLYDYLMRAGVHIHEYRTRPLHGKVAMMDDRWVTVGSSNLDPFSLSLNLEANVIALDADLNRALRGRLWHLIEHECTPAPAPRPEFSWIRQGVSFLLFHFLRWFPRFMGDRRSHRPRLAPPLVTPEPVPAATPGDDGRVDDREASNELHPRKAA
jgi:cardiolipin synthase